MLLFAVLVNALHPAFKDAEIAFKCIRVGITANIFADFVVDHFMLGGEAGSLVIGCRVRHQPGVMANVFADNPFHVSSGDGIHHGGTNGATTLDKAHNLHSVAEPATGFFPALLAADVGLISLDDFSAAAHRIKLSVLHG